MDLSEEEKVSGEVKRFLMKKFKGKVFHAVLAVEDRPGNAFVFEAGSLSETSSFQAWKTIVNGLTQYLEVFFEKFNTPTTSTINKPFELK